jgi:hypothetical protein
MGSEEWKPCLAHGVYHGFLGQPTSRNNAGIDAREAELHRCDFLLKELLPGIHEAHKPAAMVFRPRA